MDKKKLRVLLTGLIAACVGAAFGAGAILLSKSAFHDMPKLSKLELLGVLALLLPALMGLILLHEVGHLIGGWIAGFEFSFLTTGPMRVYKQDGKIRLSWNKSAELWGGIAATFPKTFDNLRPRMLWMVSGGPLASLLVGIGLYLVAGLLPLQLFLVCKILGATSFALGLLNCVPMSNGRFQSDGGKIKTLLQGGPACDRMIATTTLAVQLLDGVRPRDFQPELIAMLGDSDEVNAETFGPLFLRSQYYFDRGELAASEKILDRLIEQLDSIAYFQRPFVHLEAAYLEARYRANPAKAREYQALTKDIPKGLIKERTYLFIEAAILRAEGRVEDAAALARKALPLPATLGATVETEILREMAAMA